MGGLTMATATKTRTAIERIEATIADLRAKRAELREQLWAIAGKQPQLDRERALDTVERQLGRALVELAGLTD
jgi:hypothetical protein